jgi:hypothetical protein
MVSRKDGEPLYELPSSVGMLEAARGTVFFLDWQWLRSRKDYDRYVALIQPAVRDRLLGVTTGDWVPVEMLHVHYRALDAMGFTREQAFECGVSVGEALHGSMVRTLVRLASHLGATPWVVMGNAPKLWSRSWRGGGFLTVRLGEKSARFDIVKNPAARSAFHRGSVSGVISVGLGWLCNKLVIKELDAARTSDSFSLQVDWI